VELRKNESTQGSGLAVHFARFQKQTGPLFNAVDQALPVTIVHIIGAESKSAPIAGQRIATLVEVLRAELVSRKTIPVEQLRIAFEGGKVLEWRRPGLPPESTPAAGLTDLERRVFQELAANGPIKLVTLAARMHRANSSYLRKIVGTLVQRGLVQRTVGDPPRYFVAASSGGGDHRHGK
jgi:hypothetical protein